MKKVVRIVGKSKKDDTDFKITFEVAVTKGKVDSSMAFFGFLGSLGENNDLNPFVLYQDGRIDFGSTYEDDFERYGKTNLRDRKIEIGALFSMSTKFLELPKIQEIVYQIRQIIAVE